MKQLSQDGGRQGSARIADERGFTLVELLVAMLLSLVVIGGGVYGIAEAFKQNTSVTGRSAATAQGESGIERLVVDLRQAINTASCTSTDGKVAFTGGPISVVSSGTTTTGNVTTGGTTTIELCGPNGSVSSAPAGTVSVASYTETPVPIVWTCNLSAVSGTLTPYTCQRTVNDLGSLSIDGVYSLTLTGLVNGSSTPTGLQANSARSYALTTTLTGSQAGYLSWIGISAQLFSLQNPENPSSTTTVPNTSLVPVQTGVDLRNFGT